MRHNHWWEKEGRRATALALLMLPLSQKIPLRNGASRTPVSRLHDGYTVLYSCYGSAAFVLSFSESDKECESGSAEDGNAITGRWRYFYQPKAVCLNCHIWFSAQCFCRQKRHLLLLSQKKKAGWLQVRLLLTCTPHAAVKMRQPNSKVCSAPSFWRNCDRQR